MMLLKKFGWVHKASVTALREKVIASMSLIPCVNVARMDLIIVRIVTMLEPWRPEFRTKSKVYATAVDVLHGLSGTW